MLKIRPIRRRRLNCISIDPRMLSKSDNMTDRRQSVVPSTSYRWRSRSVATEDQEPVSGSTSSDNRMFTSAFRTASVATNHLKRVTKMFSIDKTKEVIRVALEDSDRVEYVRLACEHEELTKELKQLRGFIQELNERYEAARSLDPLRRYKRMQSMAKTIVLQLRLNDPTPTNNAANDDGNGSSDTYTGGAGSLIVGDVLQSSVKQKEMRLKHQKMGRGKLNIHFHSFQRCCPCDIEASS